MSPLMFFDLWQEAFFAAQVFEIPGILSPAVLCGLARYARWVPDAWLARPAKSHGRQATSTGDLAYSLPNTALQPPSY
jgi:hypothetical protein